MKQKIFLTSQLIVFFGIVLILSACSSSGNYYDADDIDTQNAVPVTNVSTGSQSSSSRTVEPFYKGDGGKGIVIAVPAPIMRNMAPNDNWMPQLFQDLITGDLARFSAMTVIDRSNEDLVLAEQNLTASGNYSEDDYIRMGNLTNARFIVAGSIQNISSRYNVSFRINNTETNEIKATFNKPYSRGDIENGLAAREAVKELLESFGIELTGTGERNLLSVQAVDVRATAQLARGMAAQKSDNIVEALGFLSDALGSNSTRTEASRHIQSFFVDMPTASIRERANYAIAQKEKWEKIFSDLEIYMAENLPIFIYDFSSLKDDINISRNLVNITVSPGIKTIPNRTALLVWKTIIDNWVQIKGLEENKVWAEYVRFPKLTTDSNIRFPSVSTSLDYGYRGNAGIYDNYGDRIAESNLGAGFSIRSMGEDYNMEIQVLAQQKYYDEQKFNPIMFTVPLDKVTDTMTPKIERVFCRYEGIYTKYSEFKVPVMTVAEWNEWLALQGTTR